MNHKTGIIPALKRLFGRGEQDTNRSRIKFHGSMAKKVVNALNTTDALMYYGLIFEMNWLQQHIEGNLNGKGNVISFEANALNRLLNKVVSDGTNAMGKDQHVLVGDILNDVMRFIDNLQHYGCRMKSGQEKSYDEVFVKLDLIKKTLIYFGVDLQSIKDESIHIYPLPNQRVAQ